MTKARWITATLTAAGVGVATIGAAGPAAAHSGYSGKSAHSASSKADTKKADYRKHAKNAKKDAKKLGNRSIAAVLTSDGNKFDRNWRDYDIVTEAALAVLKAKPNSPVKVITDGKTPITVFAPNDRAFRLLAMDLFKKRYSSERAVFNDLAKKLGVDTIEGVLLYHVVAGKTITSKDVLGLPKGTSVKMASGDSIKVYVYKRDRVRVMLKDKDPNDKNPFLIPGQLDLNKGNKQIAHGIDRVLRPADL